MRVLDLRGYKSLKALNAFNALMLGLKMSPAYMKLTYEEFLDMVHMMDAKDQEKVIREAAMFVTLEKDEVEALVCFCTDANGVPYTAENMKSLTADMLVNIIVAVCSEVAKIRVNFVTDSEKKNFETSQLI